MKKRRYLVGLVDACRTMPRLVMFSATCARHSSSKLRSHQAHVRLSHAVYCCCVEHHKCYIEALAPAHRTKQTLFRTVQHPYRDASQE